MGAAARAAIASATPTRPTRRNGERGVRFIWSSCRSCGLRVALPQNDACSGEPLTLKVSRHRRCVPPRGCDEPPTRRSAHGRPADRGRPGLRTRTVPPTGETTAVAHAGGSPGALVLVGGKSLSGRTSHAHPPALRPDCVAGRASTFRLGQTGSATHDQRLQVLAQRVGASCRWLTFGTHHAAHDTLTVEEAGQLVRKWFPPPKTSGDSRCRNGRVGSCSGCSPGVRHCRD